MNRSILLVDDDKNITQSLYRLFNNEGMEVFTANSGQRALEIVEEQAIDLIITDQLMPGMNGSEFLSKALKIKPNIISVMLSAYSNFDTLVHAVNEGRIVHFVAKPWDNQTLKQLVFKELLVLEAREDLGEKAELLDQLPEAWCLTTKDGRIVKCNRSFGSIAGKDCRVLIGTSFDKHLSLNNGEERIGQVIELCDKWNTWSGHLKINREGQKSSTTRVHISPYQSGSIEKYYLLTLQGDREIEILKKELNKLVLIDLESGALNRPSFIKSSEAIISSLKEEEKLMMAVIRIPKLEELSLTLSTPIFQSMCFKIISRIKSLSCRPNLIGRISNDKFAVLGNPFTLGHYDETFVNELRALFSESFKISDRDIPIIPEIGFCCYPSEATNASKMVLSAVTASTLLVGMDINRKDTRNYLIESDFLVNRDVELAIVNNELSLVYQPVIDIEKQNVKGFECLLRWFEKGEPVVSAEMLVNHIQRIGLSKKLDRFVIQTAITQLAFWKSDGVYTSIFINVSPSSLASKQFCREIISEVLCSDVDPSFINLEIVESAIIEMTPEFIENINELREFGIQIFLDEFGTGFSSFETLKHLRVDGLKVDKGFVEGVEHDKTKRNITNCLFSLANSLGCVLVAEGVETRSQLNALKDIGNEFLVQGYYFSPPFSASGVTSYLERWR